MRLINVLDEGLGISLSGGGFFAFCFVAAHATMAAALYHCCSLTQDELLLVQEDDESGGVVSICLFWQIRHEYTHRKSHAARADLLVFVFYVF
jgi:hypothetical protein